MKKLLFISVIIITIVVGFLFFIVNDEEVEFSALQRIDPIPHTKELIAEERYAEASEYLNFFLDYDYVLDNYEAIELAEHINETRDSWSYQLRKINSGFWSGESDESVGQYAAIASDFLVVGDIRDLGEEGSNYIDDEEVDKLTVALATLGIAATAAAVMPATSAAGIPAKIGISTLKGARKLGKIPKWLQKELLSNSENLPAVFETITTLKKNVGMASTLELLSISKSATHFNKLAEFGTTFQEKTIVLLKIVGEDAASLYQKSAGYSKKIYLVAATLGNRGVKFLNKYGPKKLQRFIPSHPPNFNKIVKSAPNEIGVYVVRHKGEVVYVGRAIEQRAGQSVSGLRKRLQEHYRGASTGKKELYQHRDEINITTYTRGTVEEVKKLEATLIRKYNSVENGWNLRYEG